MNATTTNPVEPNTDADISAAAPVVKLVTATMAAVVGLTFLFGFGNVLALGLRLGVPIWVAPLVAPAVDLSVLGLGIRHLALGGATTRQMRPAWRLLVFAGFVTLALNVAEPLIEQNYGRAAFDAVGPLLLIGWAEVGPGLLQAMKAIETKGTQPMSIVGPPAADEVSVQSETRRVRSAVQALPHVRHPDDEADPARRIQTAESDNVSSPVSAVSRAASGPEGGTPEDPFPNTEDGEGKEEPRQVDKKARQQDLLHRARAEDVLHWQHHQRPISAETLRKRLHVGAPTARTLVAQLRSDTHTQIEGAGDQPPAVD